MISVHNDYTEKSGPQRVRDLLPPDEAEARLKKRFAEYNVWRNIAPEPIEAMPLGFVDAESIAPRDLALCNLVYSDRVGEIYQGVYNADHQWHYFPAMTRDEAILIKCYDFGKGRPRALLAALGLRRSDLAGQRQAAPEHRGPDAGVLRLGACSSGPRASGSPHES